jgi:hypothetical protein
MIGVLLIACGVALLGAEAWLATTGLVWLAVALMALTLTTLAVIISEVREDLR